MSYIINNSRGQIVAVVADGTTNSTATDLTLVGRAVVNFGEYQNENYVYLLENFANDTAPTQPILGQLWYNSSTDVISTYSTDNVFVALASQDYVQAQKISPAFTGTPTAPTAAVATNTTQLATTAFVQNNKVSPAFSGTPTAPTAAYNNDTTQIATTAFVQGEKVSPAFFGTPTAPTASAGTNTTQIATTAFVTASPAFSGVPTAPTAVYNNNTTQIATTAFVQGEKVSPALSGVPTAPTAANSTNSTQIATTAFVLNSLENDLGTISLQDANAVAITGGTITGITALAVADGGTGASTASGARVNLGLGTISTQDSTNVNITGGTITSITALAVADGGTGANTALGARTNLSVPPNSRTITAGTGLSGGGDLSADRTFTIATNSNGYGVRTVSTADPTGGNDGDIWYQI